MSQSIPKPTETTWTAVNLSGGEKQLQDRANNKVNNHKNHSNNNNNNSDNSNNSNSNSSNNNNNNNTNDNKVSGQRSSLDLDSSLSPNDTPKSSQALQSSPGRNLNDSPESGKPSKKARRRKVDHGERLNRNLIVIKSNTNSACVYCRRSHMTCDDKRPCTRCIKRNIGHICHDEPSSSKSKGEDSSMSDIKLEESIGANNEIISPAPVVPLDDLIIGPHSEVANATGDNGQLAFSDIDGSKNRSPFNDWSSLGNQSILSHTLAFNQNPVFFSEHVGSEFSSLNDFLSMIDDPTNSGLPLLPENGLSSGLFSNSISPDLSRRNSASELSRINQALTSGQQSSGTAVGTATNSGAGTGTDTAIGSVEGSNGTNTPKRSGYASRNEPQISVSARDKFFLTAADPSEDISPEERLKQVIKAKLDAGLLQPFNYAKGYARLQKYMDNYMNQSSKQRILKPLSIFRPAFRAIAQSLMDVDLVLVEESFERMLLDYDRVFTSMAIPACLWRRTGEIYRGNKEFAGLVEVSVEDLRDGKLAIYELMSEESAVNYWEKYGNIAFDSGQKAVLTSCNLRTRDGRKRRACCFSFTIRRDRYNIPSCIVGNFIPIHP